MVGCARFGTVFGLLLEGLFGFRIPALLDDSVRRDLFRVAHAHGTLLSLGLVAAALCARLDLIRLGPMSSLGLRSAAFVLPLGFLLGGMWHFKDDPGLGVVLVPIGAFCSWGLPWVLRRPPLGHERDEEKKTKMAGTA